MGNESPEGLLRQIAENGLGIRFGRGVVGKTSHAMIGLIALWVIVIWQIGATDSPWVAGFLFLAALTPTGIFVWWTCSTQRFAERNPAQAMLDGAEFVEYKRFEAEAKGGITGSGSLINADAPPRIGGGG